MATLAIAAVKGWGNNSNRTTTMVWMPVNEAQYSANNPHWCNRPKPSSIVPNTFQFLCHSVEHPVLNSWFNDWNKIGVASAVPLPPGMNFSIVQDAVSTLCYYISPVNGRGSFDKFGLSIVLRVLMRVRALGIRDLSGCAMIPRRTLS